MIVLHLIFVLFAHAETEVRFTTECQKTEIFHGESTLCQYMLYANSYSADVEVAKFPEFRRFWSENASLRQGNMLLGETTGVGLRKTSVGSYWIAAMMGGENPHIEPMKIVVHFPNDPREYNINSDPPKLTIKQLPKIPQLWSNVPFLGWVGKFSWLGGPASIPFQKDEPTSLRLVLQGEGNFQEMDEVPLPFPKTVEVLDTRTEQQGSFQYTSKSFDVTLVVHDEKPPTIPDSAILTFNPFTKRYERLEIPPVLFQFEQKPELALSEGATPPPWRENYRFVDSPWAMNAYWGLHGLCATIFLLWAFLQWIGRLRENKTLPKDFTYKKRFQIALQAKQVGNIDIFLRMVDEIAYDILTSQLQMESNPPTRTFAIKKAKEKLGNEVASNAESIFTSYQIYAYGPIKNVPDASTFESNLMPLLKLTA